MATKASRYEALIDEFPLRPIRSERQLDRATRLANRLAVQPRLSRDEQDYLDVLSVLIEAYEDAHHPISEVSGVEALQSLIDEHGLTATELGRAVGMTGAALAAVLSGRRELSQGQLERLCAYFRVDPGLFVRPPEPVDRAG